MPIEINHRLSIPDDALEERFLAATGPGGQNVNKVATAVQMRCDTRLIDLPPFARDQLRRIAGRRMTAEGMVLDRTRVVEGKGVSVRVETGGGRIIKKKKEKKLDCKYN